MDQYSQRVSKYIYTVSMQCIIFNFIHSNSLISMQNTIALRARLLPTTLRTFTSARLLKVSEATEDCVPYNPLTKTSRRCQHDGRRRPHDPNQRGGHYRPQQEILLPKKQTASSELLSIEELSQAMTSLRREHQHATEAREKEKARRRAIALFPAVPPSVENVDSTMAWLWLNSAVYFHVDYHLVESYLLWCLAYPRKIEAKRLAATLNSLSHIFRPSADERSIPVKGMPENLKEEARKAFDNEFLLVALEFTADSEALDNIDCIMILSAFSRMGVGEEKLYAQLAAKVKRMIPQLKFGELANVAGSFVRINSDQCADLFAAMVPRARETVKVGSAKEISTLGNAFIKAGVMDKEFFDLAAVIVVGRAKAFKSHEIAALINTFAKAGVTNEETLSVLVEAAAKKCASRFTRHEICFVLPALIKFPVQTSTVFEALAKRVEEELAMSLKAIEALALFCAYAKTDCRRSGSVLKQLLSRIQELDEEYGLQEALTLIDSLTRLSRVFTRNELNAMYKTFEARAVERLLEGGMLEVVSFISMLARDPESFVAMPDVQATCQEQLKRHINEVTVAELSMLLNALSRPCCRPLLDMEVSTALVQRCQELLPQCRSIELTAIMCFFTAGISIEGIEEFQRVALTAVKDAIPAMSPIELSTTANSLSRIQLKEAAEPAIWDAIDKAATVLKTQFTPTQIGGLMSAFVRVQITPSFFFKQIVDILVTKHAASLTAHELCEILGAYAKRSFEEDTVFAALADRVSEVAPKCTPHEAATILHSFAKFGIRNEAVFYDFLPVIMKHSGILRPAEIATITVAYARVGVWNLRVFAALSARMKEVLNECSPQDIASVLNAFANMEMKDHKFLMACGDRIVSIADRCTPRVIISLLHAYNDLDVKHPALLEHFLTKLCSEATLNKATLGDCVFMATSMPKPSADADERITTLYEILARRFAKEADNLHPPALASVLHAYYRKRVKVASLTAMFEALTLRAAEMVNKFHIRNLAILLGAVSKCSDVSVHISKSVPLSTFIPRLLELIPQCNAHNIMTVSTAFVSESAHNDVKASEGTPVDPESYEQIIDALSRRAMQLLTSFRPYELAWIMRNLTVLAVGTGNLSAEQESLTRMLDRVKAVHHQLGGKDCGNLLRVCALLGVPNDSEHVELLCNRALLTISTTPPRAIAETLDSLRMMNKNVPEYFKRVQSHFEKLMSHGNFTARDEVSQMVNTAMMHFGVEQSQGSSP